MNTVSATFTVKWEGRELTATVPVPTEPVSPRIMLPMVQKLTDAFMGMGTSVVESAGQAVSCREGCATCCRHLVPLAESEARHIAEIVDAMPEPRRSETLARFDAARTALDQAGLLEKLRRPNEHTRNLDCAVEYLHLKLPCPLLENERCSIYEDRPLTCREYLVFSPAENCENPRVEAIRAVPQPGFAMTSFARLDGPGPLGVRWVPLVLAPEWAAAHPEPPAAIPGPKLFEAFMNAYLGAKKVPPPGDFTRRESETAP